MKAFLLIACFFLLGTSAWVLVNAIYAEIPLIIASMDYDYSVISKLTLCITLTSVAPIVWAMTASMCSVDNQKVTKMGIAAMLALGTSTALGMALTDAALQQTTLLIVSVCSGLVGTMANVLYYPHAATTTNSCSTDDNIDTESLSPPANVQQTTAMASGMAAGSLFLAVLAIIQQHDERTSVTFSVQAFFGVVTAVFCLSILGFGGTLIADRLATLEHNLSVSVHDTVQGQAIDQDGTMDAPINHESNNYGSIDISNNGILLRRTSTDVDTKASKSSKKLQDQDVLQMPISSAAFEIQEEAPPADEHNYDSDDHQKPLPSFLVSFLTISNRYAIINGGQFLLNLLTFFLPGIVPYSIKNFDDPQRALHYLTVTQLIAQTLGALASGWKQSRSVCLQLLVFGILWIPTVVLSFINDTEFQSASQAHSAVPITLNALLNFSYGYSRTVFYHLVHADATAGAAVLDETSETVQRRSSGNDPHIASRVLGSWNQLGAMIGSLFAYVLVEKGAIS
ncbi:hypothetical protein IV203_027836 [Nitzschia inconspicua]|uniref:Uncharacterized protein n=1 Tax=Nitzschia inconspicua TaxID=303405 RepID=A0A9K3Q4H6_9STRA|nr:hypothetical protein IV203_027836 [Nitzschia inconspicua]